MNYPLRCFYLTRSTPKNLRSGVLWACAFLLAWPIVANAQTDVLVVDGTSCCFYQFPHNSLLGATGIDFSFTGTASPSYPPTEVHTVAIVFEWGPTDTGPWTQSPPIVSTVPGGITSPITTGVYPGPDDAPFVAISFDLGGPMTIAGEFTHTSVVPEPGTLVLLGVGLMSLPMAFLRRRAKAV